MSAPDLVAIGRTGVDVYPLQHGVGLEDVDTFRKLVLGTRNDNTQWTGTVGEHKAIAWSPPIPLDDVKATAHANGDVYHGLQPHRDTRMPVVYAPMPKNAEWPIEIWPV